MFVEEGRGIIEKQRKINKDMGGGRGILARFLKKYWDFQNEVL